MSGKLPAPPVGAVPPGPSIRLRRGSGGRSSPWAWFWLILGIIYFFLPLLATLEFSLRAVRGRYTLVAFQHILADPDFYRNFGFSLLWAVITIVISLLLVVPAAYWTHLRLRRLRPVVEFITLMPFVIPAVVLVFGYIRIYGARPLVLTGSPMLLVAGYVVLSLPYMYRAVDAGLRAIDVRTLTEAALSLGASWPTVLTRVIFPNLRVALLSGTFLTLAIVVGEFTFASLLVWPAFAPYMEDLGNKQAYEAAALALISFGLTWGSIGIIQWLGRGAPGQTQVAGAH
jgi:putative spermidine/putrescine transport system permease protein